MGSWSEGKMTSGLLLRDFDVESWADQFAKQRQLIKAAQSSWEELLSESCDPDVLNLGFAMACEFAGSPGYALVSMVHTKSKEYLRGAKKLRKHLEESREAAAEIAASVNKVELVKIIDNAISELDENIKNTTAVSSLRNFNANVFLSGLCGYIENATGRAHYRELSLLLERAYAAYGRDRLIGPGEEAIRKTLDRFKKKNPEWFTPDGKFALERLKSELKGVLLVLALVHILFRISSTPAKNPDCPSPQSPDAKLTNFAHFASGRED